MDLKKNTNLTKHLPFLSTPRFCGLKTQTLLSQARRIDFEPTQPFWNTHFTTPEAYYPLHLIEILIERAYLRHTVQPHDTHSQNITGSKPQNILQLHRSKIGLPGHTLYFHAAQHEQTANNRHQKKSRIEYSEARCPKPTWAGNYAFDHRFSLSLKKITH